MGRFSSRVLPSAIRKSNKKMADQLSAKMKERGLEAKVFAEIKKVEAKIVKAKPESDPLFAKSVAALLTGNDLGTLRDIPKRLSAIESRKPENGKDGEKPIKGQDYFTDDDVADLVARVRKLIPTPKDGAKPERGVDYFTDGDIKQFIENILARIPKPKDGEDGKDAEVDYSEIVRRVVPLVPKPKDGKDGKEITEYKEYIGAVAASEVTEHEERHDHSQLHSKNFFDTHAVNPAGLKDQTQMIWNATKKEFEFKNIAMVYYSNGGSGGVSTETDPVFSAWLLASPPLYAETDPAFTAWLATVTPANWNTAYGWGNHASAGYVTGTPWTGMGYYIGDGSAFATAAQGALADTAVQGTPWTGMGYLTSVTAHNLLSATHGDTLADSVAQGDVMVGNATPKWARLAANATATRKYLSQISGGVPSWETVSSVSFGTTTQIPYMNAGGTDFLYSANMVFSGTKLTITGDIRVTNFLRYLDADTLGTQNIFMGVSSGLSNATGDLNIGIGFETLKSCDDPQRNVAIGYEAIESGNTYDPFDNVAVGYQALKVIRTAGYNVALGPQALLRLTTGGSNVAIGSQAGQNILGGTYNMLIGTQSGDSITEGYYNTCVGTYSGARNKTGSSNVFIGHYAGFGTNASTNAVVNNVGIGYQSLYLIANTGNYNTCIGGKSGYNITSGEYNVAIGYDINVPSATADYQVNIANVIKGNYTAGSEWLGLLYDKPFYFGAGSDATITYDGTNLVINPKVVGTGILDVLGTLQTDGYNAADGTAGASGTITLASITSITVKNGLITAWA